MSVFVALFCLAGCGGGGPGASESPAIRAAFAKKVETWQRKMLALGQPPAGQAAAARGDAQTFTQGLLGNDAQDEMVRASSAAGVPDCATAAAA